MWVLQFLFGLLFFSTILVGWALLANAPVIAALVLLRRRLTTLVPRLLLAAGFCASTWWLLYRMEWFDVWRHGVPSLSYLVQAYLPYSLLLGTLGWFAGSIVIPQRKTPGGLVRPGSSLEPAA